MDDIDKIIEGCRNNNPSMQRALYDKYSPKFYALCRRYSADDDIAQDVLVEGFVSIFANIKKYRGDGTFEGWMHRIIMRQIINRYKKDMKYRYLPIESEFLPEFSDGFDLATDYEKQDLIMKIMRSLTEEERTLVNLVAVDEYTFKEISKMFGMPENTVKSRYYRIKDKLNFNYGKYFRI